MRNRPALSALFLLSRPAGVGSDIDLDLPGDEAFKAPPSIAHTP